MYKRKLTKKFWLFLALLHFHACSYICWSVTSMIPYFIHQVSDILCCIRGIIRQQHQTHGLQMEAGNSNLYCYANQVNVMFHVTCKKEKDWYPISIISFNEIPTWGHCSMYGISILSRTSTASRIITRELLRLQGKKRSQNPILFLLFFLKKMLTALKNIYILQVKIVFRLFYF